MSMVVWQVLHAYYVHSGLHFSQWTRLEEEGYVMHPPALLDMPILTTLCMCMCMLRLEEEGDVMHPQLAAREARRVHEADP